MSAIPIVGKVFEEIDKNPILKTAAIAAVIYFTASAASSYFAAEGVAVAGSGGSLATTTSVTATSLASAGGTAGTAGTAGGGALGLNVSLPTALTGAEIATAEVAAAQLGTSVAATSWLTSNPLATMVLAQGVSGAAAGFQAEETANKNRALQEKQLQEQVNARKDRGLFGYNYDGSPGIINSQVQQPVARQSPANQQSATAAPQSVVQGVNQQATAVPIIASQQLQPQEMSGSPQRTAIQRSDLPKLNKQRV